MSFDIEAVKARCAAATADLGDDVVLLHVKFSEVREVEALAREVSHARTDLPDAIELIEEAEDLLLDARPVIGGDSEAEWCRKLEAWIVKIRPQTEQKGT